MKRVKSLTASLCAVGLALNLTIPAYAADLSSQGIKQIEINNTSIQNDKESDQIIVKYEEYVPEAFETAVTKKLMNTPKAKVEKVKEVGIYTIDTENMTKDPEELVDLFNAKSIVEYAEIDAVARMSAVTPNDTYYARYQASTLSAMKVQDAWDIAKGSNAIVVAVVDSGVDPNHPDLQGRVVSGYDFVNDDSNPVDDNGHGTMVAGIIAANTNNSKGIAGGDWNCYVMPVKVLDNKGVGFVSKIAAGITYAADNGADVINCSLGTTSRAKVLEDAVNYAYSKGCLVVAATGNTASAIQYPAAFDNAISVGAVTASKSLADYSCYGGQIDLVAVGSEVTSTYSNGSTVSYGKGNGTSFAAPYVSALASLVLSVNNKLTPDEVFTVMKDKAIDLGASGWDNRYGYGCISFSDTLKSVANIKDTAPVIKLKGAETVTISKGEKYVDEGATATDKEDGDLTKAIKVEGSVNTKVAGTYTLKYMVTDKANNISTATRTVVVKDNNGKPVISLKGNRVVDLKVGDNFYDEGAVASDAEDGNLTNKIIISGTVNTNRAGTYYISYNVEDSKGLMADTVQRIVNVSEGKPVQPAMNKAPVITLNGSGALSMEKGGSYSDAGVRVYDEEDGDITYKVKVDGYVDTNRAGSYSITYTVTDSQGLSARPVTRNVSIFEVDRKPTNSRPVITLKGQNLDIVTLRSDYRDAGVVAMDKEDGDISGKVVVTGFVDTNTAGVYKLVYGVRDSEGLAAFEVTRMVSVNGNKAPEITLFGDTTVMLHLGDTYREAGASAFDREDGNVTSSIVVDGTVDTSKAGSYMLKYTAKDSSGAVSKPAFRYVVVAP